MSALRLLLLSALAASASGYIPTLSGPVRAAEAHERGGLSPFHFKWGRRQRRELGAEGTESSGESGEHGLDEEAKEEIQDWTSTLCLVALALTFVFGHFLESIHFDFLPEAGVGILLGAALAGTTITMLGAVRQDEMVSDERFDAKFFFVWLIPPIIFEAGFNMDAKAFFANIAPTIFFAFVGTFLSTFVVGGWVYYFGQLGWGYPMALLPCLVFGSLISATDPVTVLAVFQALGVKVDLFSMVFGESVLNDAVAIVLSETLLTFQTPMPGVSFSSRVVAAVVQFCSIFGWSLVIGAIYGAASAFVLKVADLRHHAESKFIGVALVAAFAWASYFTAEALQKSGIVTIMFCGIVMAFYARDNLHPEAQALAKDAFKCTALIAETFVFVYLGMAVFTFPILAPTTVWGFTFIMAVPACFVGRLHIYLGSWLTNCARDATTALPPISSTYQFIMWFSGLRGGVAFALAAGIYAEAKFPETCGGAPERGPEHNCVPAMSDGLAMLQATLLIAAMTIFVFGGAITSVCRWGQVLEDKNAPKVEAPEEGHGPPVGLLARIDTYFLHPLLTAGDVPGDGHHGPPPNGTEMGNYAQLKEEKAAPAAAPAPATRLVGAIAPRAGSSRGAAPVAPAAAPAAPGDLKGEDAVDALRTKMPSYSGDQLRALLNASGGSYTAAVQRARSGVATELL